MTRAEINEEKQKEIFKEQNKATAKKIIVNFIKLVFILTVIGIGFFSYTTYISTIKITIREYRIIDKKIPNSFNGLKIIHFSDLDYGSTMFQENIKKIKKMINERKPDIIIFTGDLVDDKYNISQDEKEVLLKHLKEMSAKLGKYAVLGDNDKDDEANILNQSEFITLKNESDLIYNQNNIPILLIGLSSLNNNEQDITKAFQYFSQESYNTEIYTISLVHEPDSTIEILEKYPNTNLILSGHSHNGYIRIPFVNIPLSSKQGAKKYNQDFYQINDTKLYVSGGLGTNNSSGIRLFCRPSINFYRLSNQ